MAQTDHPSNNAHSYLQEDLQKSLAKVLQSFTQYNDNASLKTCVSQLEHLRDTINMLNLKGANLLAKEIFNSASYLTGSHVDNLLEIQESILKGLHLLPHYLRVLSVDLQDHPLRLISTINALRGARNEPELHPLSLFYPRRIGQLPKVILSRLSSISSNRLSLNKLSLSFQSSLLHWIKESDQNSLRKLGRILSHLRSYSSNEVSIELWWAGEGVIEALIQDGLTVNHEIKLKLGELSSSIKQFSVEGESYLQSEFPTQLFHHLLLFVAKATSNGEYVFLLKSTFDLSFFQPEQHQKIYPADSLFYIESPLQNNSLIDSKSVAPYIPLHKIVLRECQSDLSLIKESLPLLSKNASNVLISTIPDKLNDLGSCLAMIELDDATNLFQAISIQLSWAINNPEALSLQNINLFEDMIVCTDLYMANLCQTGKPSPSLLIEGHNILKRLAHIPAHDCNLIKEKLENEHDNLSIASSTKTHSQSLDKKSSVEQYINILEQQLTRPADIASSSKNVGVFIVKQDNSELLDAFTEECAELLESSHIAINNWQKDHNDSEAAHQLQRVLHTLKGSARLTDIFPIADLTHHTESLVSLIVENNLTANDAFYSLLHRSQNCLLIMQKHLTNNEGIPFFHDLLSEIAIFSGQPASAAVKALPQAALEVPTPIIDEKIQGQANVLSFLSNFAHEANVSRDLVSQKNTAIQQQLTDMQSTVTHLKEQLRNLEVETEIQAPQSILHPLKSERLSMIKKLSQNVTRSVRDISSISHSIDGLVRDSDLILHQQLRLSIELEQQLINSRLSPFIDVVPRFEHLIHQINSDLNKQSLLLVVNAEYELDRTILERITAPLEHLIRNAVAHGIESPENRKKLSKNERGQITLTLSREGSDILISLADDGQGIDIEKVRKEALKRDLINLQHMPSDDELIQLILLSGFSTAETLTLISGRGIGMDVVNSEVRSLKGHLSIHSIPGSGTTISLRLPLTFPSIKSLLIRSHNEQFAIPLSTVHANSQISVVELHDLLEKSDVEKYEFNGEYYQLSSLANLLDQPLVLPNNPKEQLPLLLFRKGSKRIALIIDAILSHREMVLKSIGKQLNHIDSIIGATTLNDGKIIFILDIPVLIDSSNISPINTAKGRSNHHVPPSMVIDDSVTTY